MEMKFVISSGKFLMLFHFALLSLKASFFELDATSTKRAKALKSLYELAEAMHCSLMKKGLCASS
jgi:hypothetical protein